MGEFAEGLKDFFTVGAYVKPIRLNKRMKEILFLMIEDSLENTSINFKEDEESAYNSFMDSMTWLTQELSREKIHKINLNKKIALVIFHWIWANRFYHLSSDPEFENAMQWVTNKISKKYAHGHLIWK